MMGDIQCVLLLGGRGTRLGLRDRPKPMVEILGQPLLERTLANLRAQNVRRFVFLVNHMEDVLRYHFGDGSGWGIEITWVSDPNSMGTAGATAAAEHVLDDSFIIVYGDLLFDVDLARFCRAARAAGGHGTLMIHPNDHPADSDLVEVVESRERTAQISAFLCKPHPPSTLRRNMATAGIYYLKKVALRDIPVDIEKPDWARDVFANAVAKGSRYFGYRTIEYIKDIGTPERVEKATKALQRGLPAKRSYNASQPAVFLDRDGVINREINGVHRSADLELLPGAGDAIARLNAAGLPVILATNQPAVARGFMSESDLLEVHAQLDHLLGIHGAFLDDRYVCIHHPESGHPGERRSLKIECECRKPKGGLLRRAAQEHNLDLTSSVMIGDREADVTAVLSVGGRAIRVATNGELSPRNLCALDAKDLASAVDLLLVFTT